MKYLRSAVAALGLGAATLGVLPFTWAAGWLDPSRRTGWTTTRLWAWIVLVTGGVTGLRFKNLSPLHRRGGAIVMTNHESLFDPVMLMAGSRGPLCFIARHSLFRIPLLGWAMRSNGHVPVERGRPRSAQRCLERAARELYAGRMVVIFPEGSRGPGGELLPFQRGGFLLAARTGAPIVPAAIAGTRQVCPKGRHWAGTSRVALVAGTPIATSNREVADVMAEVRAAILRLRSEAAAMVHADGPLLRIEDNRRSAPVAVQALRAGAAPWSTGPEKS